MALLRATFVTTLDNPYDYWTQFDEWYAFDTEKGYNTCSYVARIAKTSNDMSDQDRVKAINDAVDEILRLNLTGNYIITEEKQKMDMKNRKNDMENGENEDFDTRGEG